MMSTFSCDFVKTASSQLHVYSTYMAPGFYLVKHQYFKHILVMHQRDFADYLISQFLIYLLTNTDNQFDF